MDMIDLPDLLSPISDTAPSGADLREDATPQSVYFRLRDARAEARAAERLADNDPEAGDAGAPHWAAIRSLATQALAADAKDLEIAAWLTESLVRAEGLGGLAVGANLLAGLIGRFWNAGLYPVIDEEGAEARLAALAGLSGQGVDGSLMQPLRKLTLFERGDGTAVSLWQYEQAEVLASEANKERRAQRIAAGAPELATLETEMRGAGDALGRVAQDAAAALRAWEALDGALSDKAGTAAPNMRRVHATLAKLHRLTRRYGIAAEPARASAPDDPAPGPADAPAPAQDGREALLDQVVRIAARFRASEPNSPLSYTLEEAVRRARLPWPDLLQELLPEAAPRAAVMTGLGLRAP